MSQNDVEVKFGGSTAELTAAIEQVKASIGSMHQSVGQSLALVGRAFVAFQAVLAGGKLFHEAVDSAISLQKETTKLSVVLGMTTEDATALHVALGDIFLSSDDLLSASSALTRQLKINESAFNDLGIVTRDQNGHLRNTMAIMLDANKTILEFKAGQDQQQIGMRLYGRSWAEVSGIVKLNADVMEEAKQKADELGLVVGSSTTQAIKDYRHAMHDAHLKTEAMKNIAGQELIPVLTHLANWFNSDGPNSVNTFRTAMRYLAVVLEGVIGVVKALWEVVKAYAQSLTVLGETIGELMYKVAHPGSGRSFADIGAEAATKFTAVWANALTNIVKDASDAKKNIDDILSGKNTGNAGGPASPPGGDRTAGADRSRHEKEIRLQMEAEADLAILDQRRAMLEHEKALGEQHALQQLATLKQLEEERYQIQLAALQKREQLYAHDRDKLAELEAQKAKIKQQYEQQTLALQNKTVQETAARYQQMSAGMQNAYTTGLQQMVRGQQSAREVMRNVGWALVDEFIAQQVKMVVSHQINEAAKTASTVAGSQTRVAAEATAGAETVAISGSTSLMEILNAAWVGAANVFKSVAEIPGVGWILAPALAMGAAATVMSFGRRIASAAGGWEVPSDQIAQVHKNEMILPAHLSDRIRHMTDTGNKGPITVHYHVQAMDSGDVKRFFDKHGPSLADSLRKQVRNFSPVKA